jgi:hypothetical protein
MKHSHQSGWEPKEIYEFADCIISDKKNRFPRIVEYKVINSFDKYVLITFSSDVPIEKTIVMYTNDFRDPFNCLWSLEEKEVTVESSRLEVLIPDDARFCFINLVNAYGINTSTPLIEL